MCGWDVSYPGHGFLSAVVSLCHRRRCTARSNWWWAAFWWTGIRRRRHGTRDDRIAKRIYLSMCCRSQTAGNYQGTSSGFEAFIRHLRCRIDCDFGCFHWSFRALVRCVFSVCVWVFELLRDWSHCPWLLKLTLNVRKSAPVCRWWSYAQRCGFSHSERNLEQIDGRRLYKRIKGG